jgi:hypothetical protein
LHSLAFACIRLPPGTLCCLYAKSNESHCLPCLPYLLWSPPCRLLASLACVCLHLHFAAFCCIRMPSSPSSPSLVFARLRLHARMHFTCISLAFCSLTFAALRLRACLH